MEYDNSYQVTGKVCPPSLPMSMLSSTSLQNWPSLIPPDSLKILLQESQIQDLAHGSLPDNLCAIASQAQVVLRTEASSSLSSAVVSLPYYFCNFCNHHTDSQTLLLKHLAEKHIFQCNLCNHCSLTRSGLVQHQLKSHIDAEIFKPVLSTKHVHVNLSQMCKQVQRRRSSSPERDAIWSGSQPHVSSASMHQDDNFLLLPSAQSVSDLPGAIPTTVSNENQQINQNSENYEAKSMSYSSKSIPHFLDLRSARVSSSSLSPTDGQGQTTRDTESTDESFALASSSSMPQLTDVQFETETNAHDAASFHDDELLQFRRRIRSRSCSPVDVATPKEEPTKTLFDEHVARSLSSEDISSHSPSDFGHLSGRSSSCAETESKNICLSTSQSSYGDRGRLDNFLLGHNKFHHANSPFENVEKEISHVESMNSGNSHVISKNESAFQSRGNKGKSFDILRGLLVGDTHLNTSSAVDTPDRQRMSETCSPCTSAVKINEPVRASDMSLRELLIQPGPINFQVDKKETQVPKLSSSSVLLVCGFCNLECINESKLIEHVKECKDKVEHHQVKRQSESSLSLTVPVLPDKLSQRIGDDQEVLNEEEDDELQKSRENQNTFSPNHCVASEMLRSISHHYSEKQQYFDARQKKNAFHSHGNASLKGLLKRKETLHLGEYSQPQQGHASHRPEAEQSHLNSVSSHEIESDVAKHSTSAFRRKRRFSEDDSDYVFENDTISSVSESEPSSSDSEEWSKIRQRRHKRLKVKTHIKTKNPANVLTCLHCTYFVDSRFSMRNHLSSHHPNGVPFAAMSLRGGRKSVAYFCQGLNRKCSFVSYTGFEMISHIKHCYFGMLDGFNNSTGKPDLDHTFVLSSLGIASKLTNSGPSTYICLRCDHKSQNLEPLLTHATADHDNSIAGVLHVSISGDNSKHTQVRMVCLVCKLHVSVDQWKSHVCRSLELERVKEEVVECIQKDVTTHEVENSVPESIKKEIEQDLVPNEGKDNGGDDDGKNTQSPGEVSKSEKRQVEKDCACFDTRSNCLPTFSKLLTALTTNETLPRRDPVQVEERPTEGECLPNFGKLFAPVMSAKGAPVKKNAQVDEKQPSTEGLPNFSKLLNPEKKSTVAIDVYKKTTIVEKNKQTNEGFIQISGNQARNNAWTEASENLSGPQTQQNRAMCVISNCFSMTASEKDQKLSESDDCDLQYNNIDALPNQSSRPSQSSVNTSTRSVLHGLLSSQSQSTVTSSNSLSLLENLLTSPNTLTSVNGRPQTRSTDIRPGNQRASHGSLQPSVPLPLPSISKNFVKKDNRAHNSGHQGDKVLNPHNRKQSMPGYVPTSQAVKNIIRVGDSLNIIPNPPKPQHTVIFQRVPQKLQNSIVKKAGTSEMLSIQIPSSSSSEEDLVKHGSTSTTTESQALSPPAKIPTPPQLPSHLRPLSPLPQPTHSPVQVAPYSSHAAISTGQEISCSPGTSQQSASESGPPHVQSSPFTNLLRDLLCKSKSEDVKK